jgi:hypothetical protein
MDTFDDTVIPLTNLRPYLDEDASILVDYLEEKGFLGLACNEVWAFIESHGLQRHALNEWHVVDCYHGNKVWNSQWSNVVSFLIKERFELVYRNGGVLC